MNKFNYRKLNFKYLKTAFYLGLVVLAGILLSLGAINYYVARLGTQYVYAAEQVPAADAVLILGAYVSPDGTLSDMLRDREIVGYELYKQGKAAKIIVSGDHGRPEYDEVNSMKNFLKNKGVPGQDVFMDHAGFSTYESIYRARDIFQAKRVIIVTQRYHLLRAVFVARQLGLEAYGVPADLHDYGPIGIYEAREIAARNKDFWMTVFKPQPTFLGDAIPVFGDGDATDDK